MLRSFRSDGVGNGLRALEAIDRRALDRFSILVGHANLIAAHAHWKRFSRDAGDLIWAGCPMGLRQVGRIGLHAQRHIVAAAKKPLP